MRHQRSVLAAASIRLVFAAIMIVFLPFVYPKFEQAVWVFLGYFGCAAASQLLIWLDIGGMPRTVAQGIIDIAVVTYVVHQVGSPATVFVSLYFLLAILNTLVISRRYGFFMMTLGIVSYGAILLAESVGWITYGPSAPRWATGPAPSPLEALASWFVVAVFLTATTRATARAVQKIEEHEESLQELSQRDPLTSLYNRRHVLERIAHELNHVRRNRPMSVLMLDLDGFKSLNDSQGHIRGDELLNGVADVLRSATRATDAAGRYGGDEFVVVLADTDGPRAHTVAERLQQQIRAVGERFDAERPVTASIGLAAAEPEDTPVDLVRRADTRVYQAKRAGGDRIAGGGQEHASEATNAEQSA